MMIAYKRRRFKSSYDFFLVLVLLKFFRFDRLDLHLGWIGSINAKHCIATKLQLIQLT